MSGGFTLANQFIGQVVAINNLWIEGNITPEAAMKAINEYLMILKETLERLR
jgi:hypothetical protein